MHRIGTNRYAAPLRPKLRLGRTLGGTLAVLLAACTGTDPQRVEHWTLEHPPEPARAIELPTRIDDHVRPGDTYRIEAHPRLSPRLRGQDLEFIWPMFQGRAQLTVDGREVTPLFPDFVNGHRRRGFQAWAIPRQMTDVDTIALGIVVEHTWARSTWLDSVPQLALKGASRTDAHRLINDVGSTIALVSLVQVGFILLLIYVVDRRRKEFLWSAVQNLTVAYYPFYMLGLGQLLVGTADVSTVGILLAAAPVASIYYTHAVFHLGPPSRMWPYALLMCVGLGVGFRDPFLAPNIMGRSTVLIVVSAVLYQLFTTARLALRKPRPANAVVHLAGWIFLALTTWSDILNWLGFGESFNGVRLASLGLALFAVVHCVLLSQQYVLSLRNSDVLNQELANRIDALESHRQEVEHLNNELQSQISKRSGQLVAALAIQGKKMSFAPDLKEGDTVQNRYRVVRKLGEGGMGSVYEVVRNADQKRLALKITHGLDGVTLARLAREAQIASQVRHPNVVSIYDIDVAESGFIYLVLEYVNGSTVGRCVEHFGQPDWALPVLKQLAAGLSALHAQGVIHRDLKPSNLLLSDDSSGAPVLKIVDFGISRLEMKGHGDQLNPANASHVSEESLPSLETFSEGSLLELEPSSSANGSDRRDDITKQVLAPPSSAMLSQSIPTADMHFQSGFSTQNPELTQVGVLIGTPRYMAPELALRPESVSKASDVFAFGVIAFELLTRKRPFRKPPVQALIDGESFAKPPSLRKTASGLRRSQYAILDACMSRYPEERPEISEVLLALEDKMDDIASNPDAGDREL
jgi:serine/threonine protein kinase